MWHYSVKGLERVEPMTALGGISSPRNTLTPLGAGADLPTLAKRSGGFEPLPPLPLKNASL